MYQRLATHNHNTGRHRPPIHDQPCVVPSYYPRLHCHSSAQVLEELQQGIRDLEGYQNFLESEIQKKQERLQQVRTSLSQKITKAKELKNSLAPISRLPNEMLLVIFEELVSSPAPGNGKEMCAAMWVSHVSRRWRDVAVSSPRLWRHIWVGPQVGPRVLEAYISRGSGSFDGRATLFNFLSITIPQFSKRWMLRIFHWQEIYPHG
ncbi:hypothetical protein SCLCIDRAFT_475561 [Scleroderma citrinum Foug A]|uniref:F-box domain-containing protein n=1 Tax=Scleroderma citrinum Foug A TaxID=1036808 RepID=A0A0C3DA43_9AGAM|nr:hypothetical protein SCLCIDRAFT_475561 [Scleroderma citrinum Foug A]